MGFTRPPRAITIDDVADKAGVSAKTVSRVLNNEPNVRPAKRDLVIAAAKDLGYRPNPAARSLAGARSFLIAHLHDNPVPEYVSAVNAGIYEACRAKGYFLMPEPVDRTAPDALDRLQSFLMTSRADGVVLTPPICDDPDILAMLQENGTAYASLSPSRRPENTAAMRMDDRLATMEMIRYLVSIGHRTIAFIAGPQGHNASKERRKGYLDAMTEAGLTVSPEMMAAGDYTLRSGLLAAQALITAPTRPTAVFAANDDMAVGAMTAIMAEGLRIPQDISVAGFDDTRMASVVWPPLTTIRQPVSAMARRAAERLMTHEDDAPLEEVFDFELVVRQSTAPVQS